MNWLTQLFNSMFRPMQCWVVLAPWERGVRVRLGKNGTPLEPGIHLRIPFLDRIFVQSVRLRTVQSTGQTVTTADGKALTLAIAVSYAINDILKLHQSVSNPETTLQYQSQGIAAKLVQATASSSLRPSQVEEAVTQSLNAANWGLGDIEVYVTTWAYARVYRLLNYEYRTSTKLDDMEEQAARC